MSVEKRLRELGYTLPEPPTPKGVYVTALEVDGMLYTSGSTCFEAGGLKYQGKLGADLTVEEGYDACKVTVLNLLSVIKQHIGDLDRIERVVKLTGYVASAPGFGMQPAVLNGASEPLVEILGERGKHARSVMGVNELPMNSPVEIEMIVKLED
ncbi:MAG TPA: RidA family protein [Anaerolineae bacterium]|nr:RidA family protein [Anaerolineae bacterium]